MSLSQQVDITCVSCGRKLTITTWLSIHAQQHPALKTQLLQHSLHRKACESCGAVNTVAIPILYHDPKHPSMIWFNPNQHAPDEHIQNIMDNLPVEIMQRYMFRIVSDMNSLIEKIRCFDDALDDRVMELVKLLLLQQWLKQHPDSSTEIRIYYTDTTENTRSSRLNFVILAPQKDETNTISIPRYIYDGVLSDFRSLLRDNASWQVIDRGYAAQLFQKFHSATQTET